MITEGKISIELRHIPDRRSPKVSIRSNRQSNIGKILCGRTAQEALSLLPMIYGVCGGAHSCVASRAFRTVDQQFGGGEVAGWLVVLAENAREHLLRVILGWVADRPKSVKQFPVSAIMSLVADMGDATSGGDKGGIDPEAVKDVAASLTQILDDHLFAQSPEQWLQLRSLSEVEAWIQSNDTIASRYLKDICDKNWQSVGANSVNFLPQLSMAELRKKMHDVDGSRFISQPVWQGTSYETGPLARWHNHALVAPVFEKYGSGLLARNVARLVELASIPGMLNCLANSVSEQFVGEREQQQDFVVGIASVETARGRLVHSLKMQDGLIDDYCILAPTEWNFHPCGAAAKGLETLDAENKENLRLQASMLIEAIDPCVEFEVRIS